MGGGIERAPSTVSRRWNVQAQVAARLQPFTLSRRHLLEGKQTQLKIDPPRFQLSPHTASLSPHPPAPSLPTRGACGKRELPKCCCTWTASAISWRSLVFATRRNKADETFCRKQLVQGPSLTVTGARASPRVGCDCARSSLMERFGHQFSFKVNLT